jgi:hypothetical protein
MLKPLKLPSNFHPVFCFDVFQGQFIILFVDEAKDGDMSATRAMICLSRGGQDAFQAAELSGARAMNHNEPTSSMEQQFHDSPGVSRNFHQSPLSH